MSLRVFSPLEATACGPTITRALPATAEVQCNAEDIVVSLRQYMIQIVIEKCRSVQTSHGGYNSEISFTSIRPPEGETALEDSMKGDIVLYQAVRAMIRTLRHASIFDDGGTPVTLDDLTPER